MNLRHIARHPIDTLRRRKHRQRIDASCPRGGQHQWDIMAYGPDGSAFECEKCGEVWESLPS
jgi:hypothetical protein